MASPTAPKLIYVRGTALLLGLGCLAVYTQDDMPILLGGMGIAGFAFALTFLFGRRPSSSDSASEPTVSPPDEWRILRAAAGRLGRITAIEAAADTESTLAAAEEGLDSLQRQGACTVEVSTIGQVVYCFPDFTSPEAKTDLV